MCYSVSEVAILNLIYTSRRLHPFRYVFTILCNNNVLEWKTLKNNSKSHPTVMELRLECKLATRNAKLLERVTCLEIKGKGAKVNYSVINISPKVK